MAKETITITKRWSWLPSLSVEIECDPALPPRVKLGLAVEVAYEKKLNLTDAVLTRADLTGADLTGAVLTDAVLTDAVLTRAVLTRAVLTRADLTGAVLTDADLTGAVLTRADLTGAVLTDAVLPPEAQRPFKADLWATLISLRAAPLEIADLVRRLREGQVDGSTYGRTDNPCACLVGSIAKARGVAGESLDHNSDRPAERWFMMIRPGDKAGDLTGGGTAAQYALDWTLELCGHLGIDPDAILPAQTDTRPLEAN